MYKKSIAIRETIVKSDPNNAIWIGYLALTYGYYADALEKSDDLRKALETYKKAFDLLNKDPSNQYWQKSLGTFQGKVAELTRRLAETPKP